MGKSNFIDPETKEEFFFPLYKMVFSNLGAKYVDKQTNKQIVNPKNGNILESIPKEIGAPMLLKSNDRATRIEMLKKRSKDHYKKEISEKRHEMNKNLIKKFEGN